MLHALANVGVDQDRRAQDLTEAVEPERGQSGQPDQHAHGARDHYQACREAVALTSRQGEHAGGERCDDQSEAEAANRQRDVGLPDRSEVERELVGAPPRHLHERERRKHEARRGGDAVSRTRGQKSTSDRSDGDAKKELSQEQSGVQRVETEDEAAKDRYVDEGHHERGSDQDVRSRYAAEAPAAQEIAWDQWLKPPNLPPPVCSEKKHGREACWNDQRVE